MPEQQYQEDYADQYAEQYSDQTAVQAAFTPDPVRNPVENDAKLISSGMKDSHLTFNNPVFKEITAWEVFVDARTGKPKLHDGLPVIKRKVSRTIFTGEYKKIVIDFPIKNFFSDSMTSTHLVERDVKMASVLYDGIMDLNSDSIRTGADHSALMSKLFVKAAVIFDTHKSLGGMGAQLYKTTITKGEQNWNKSMRMEGYDEFDKRRQKKGLLGMGGTIWTLGL